MTASTLLHVPQKQFPTLAGIFLGIGLGGFFDGIVFHQILQWHHLVSTVYAPDSLPNIQFNTLMDGLFHAATYAFVIVGLVISGTRRAKALCMRLGEC